MKKDTNFCRSSFFGIHLEIPACMLQQNNSNQSDFHGRPDRGLHKKHCFITMQVYFLVLLLKVRGAKRQNQWHTHRYNNFIVEYTGCIFIFTYIWYSNRFRRCGIYLSSVWATSPIFFWGEDKLQGISPKTVSSWCRMMPPEEMFFLRGFAVILFEPQYLFCLGGGVCWEDIL